MNTTPPQPEPEFPHESAAAPAFFPVPTDSLDTHELELDLYLMHDGRRPVLYRSVGSAYSMADCAKLAEQGVEHLYVPTAQHRVFRRMMTERLVRAYEDPELAWADRRRAVHAACGRMIDDLMHFPHLDGIFQTLGEIAGRMGRWCAEDEARFGELLDMSDRELRTAEHMVNVGVGCCLLAAELLGPESPALRDIVQGALTHDVGKRVVAPGVHAKEGRLSEHEWEQLRTHPAAGVEVLSAQTGTTSVAIAMARDHHERLDGHGYPAGLKGNEIGLPARLCAVVDIFDSIGAGRANRGGYPPARVLDSMREEAGTILDRRVFDAWARVVERVVDRHPERCVPESAGLRPPRVRMMVPSAPKQATVRGDPAARAVVATGAERACDLPVRIHTRATDGGPGEPADGRIVRIGRGTVGLETRSPARAGQLLRVGVPDGPVLDLLVQAHHYGPGGETVLECAVVTARRAG